MALDYKNLSIAKPIDGQMVSEAEGTITVEQTKAVIAAKAKLGGVPAEIDAVEPLADGKIERKRLVTLILDDKTREAVVPGHCRARRRDRSRSRSMRKVAAGG